MSQAEVQGVIPRIDWERLLENNPMTMISVFRKDKLHNYWDDPEKYTVSVKIVLINDDEEFYYDSEGYTEGCWGHIF
jgi:hypothetical protein